MIVYVLTTADNDDAYGYRDVLDSGVPYQSVEDARAAAQQELLDELGDPEDDPQIEWIEGAFQDDGEYTDPRNDVEYIFRVRKFNLEVAT